MDSTLNALQSLDVPPLTLLALVLAVLALVTSDPVVGRRDHRALLIELDADPTGAEDARVRFYRRWVGYGWLWAAATVALVSGLPGIGLPSLGLQLPDVGRLGGSVWADLREDFSGDEALESVAGLVVGLLLAAAVLLIVHRLAGRRTGERGAGERGAGERRAPDGPPRIAAAALDPMLPTTARERRGWAMLSLTAGVTEEVTYRGLVVLTLALLLPSVEPPVVVLAAAVLFGLAHAYQGPAGMVVTGIIGVALTGMYLATGSLLVPMIVHVLIDLRSAFVRPAPSPAATHGAPA